MLQLRAALPFWVILSGAGAVKMKQINLFPVLLIIHPVSESE
jgi:hypothetical protein